MNAYRTLRSILCVLFITMAIFLTVDIFFDGSYHIDIYGEIIYETQHFNFDSTSLMLYAAYILLGAFAIWVVIYEPYHVYFMPICAFLLGAGFLYYSIMEVIIFGFRFLYVFQFAISIGMMFCAISFTKGNLHNVTRILYLSVILGIIIILRILYMMDQASIPYNIFNFIFFEPDQFLLMVCYFLFAAFAIYPDDFEETRLSRSLSDVEYTLGNRPHVAITEKSLEILSGKTEEGWHPSSNPKVESEAEIQIFGSRAHYNLLCRKWKDDDGIRITFIVDNNRCTTWGTGAKILYIANDNTVSHLNSRVVRIYTDNGFFYRIIVMEDRPVYGGKYKSKIASFFED